MSEARASSLIASDEQDNDPERLRTSQPDQAASPSTAGNDASNRRENRVPATSTTTAGEQQRPDQNTTARPGPGLYEKQSQATASRIASENVDPSTELPLVLYNNGTNTLAWDVRKGTKKSARQRQVTVEEVVDESEGLASPKDITDDSSDWKWERDSDGDVSGSNAKTGNQERNRNLSQKEPNSHQSPPPRVRFAGMSDDETVLRSRNLSSAELWSPRRYEQREPRLGESTWRIPRWNSDDNHFEPYISPLSRPSTSIDHFTLPLEIPLIPQPPPRRINRRRPNRPSPWNSDHEDPYPPNQRSWSSLPMPALPSPYSTPEIPRYTESLYSLPSAAGSWATFPGPSQSSGSDSDSSVDFSISVPPEADPNMDIPPPIRRMTRRSTFPEVLSRHKTDKVHITSSRFVGNPGDDDFGIDLAAEFEPDASNTSNHFQWLHITQDNLDLSVFRRAALNSTGISDSEREEVSILLDTVQAQFQKTSRDAEGRAQKFFEGNLTLRHFNHKDKSSTGCSVVFFALPYFSLEKVTPESALWPQQHTTRTLLQVAHPSSDVRRDVDQAICQLVPDLYGQCLHVCQTWVLLINEKVLVTCSRLDLRELHPGSITPTPVTLPSNIRVVQKSNKKTWLFNVTECASWLVGYSCFVPLTKD
jgi:hypothetical protein